MKVIPESFSVDDVPHAAERETYQELGNTQISVRIAHLDFLAEFHSQLVTDEMKTERQSLVSTLESRLINKQDTSSLEARIEANKNRFGTQPQKTRKAIGKTAIR